MEDMVANRGFLQVSEVGTMRDEVGDCAEPAFDQNSVMRPTRVINHNLQIIAEELSKGLRAETGLQPSVVWGKEAIRLCVVRETNNQVGGWMDEFALSGDYPTCLFAVPDSIDGLVGGMCLLMTP